LDFNLQLFQEKLYSKKHTFSVNAFAGSVDYRELEKGYMKAISSKITKGLPVGAILNCADNTGVKQLEIIAVRGFKGKRRTKPSAGVASVIVCRVKTGTEKVRHEIFKAVIIRQKKEYRRPDGIRISFEDNAAILVDDKFEPKGSIIKGPVAKEAVERFPTIGKIANMVV
jgi:large subunit ribosomal protein L14